MPISVVINTYNAERHLAEVLETVKDFDEVLICDMESTDSTREIALRYGCRIVTFEKKNYNIVEPAREFAIHQATHEWVLVVDADELIPSPLKDYLYKKIEEPDCPDALLVARKNHMMGCFMRSSYPDYQLRFFRKEKTHWPPIIHARPQVDGTIGSIPKQLEECAMVHKSETMSNAFRHVNEYTDNEVKRRKGTHVTWAKLIFQPFFRFFKGYVMKGGFRYGKVGYIQACKHAYYKFVVLCKLLEQERMQQQANKKQTP